MASGMSAGMGRGAADLGLGANKTPDSNGQQATSIAARQIILRRTGGTPLDRCRYRAMSWILGTAAKADRSAAGPAPARRLLPAGGARASSGPSALDQRTEP